MNNFQSMVVYVLAFWVIPVWGVWSVVGFS